MKQRHIGLISIAMLMVLTWLMTTPADARLALTATPSPTVEAGSRELPLSNPCTKKPFTTIMTNAGIAKASAYLDQNYNSWNIQFELAANDEAAAFSAFTAKHEGQPIAIVLDGKVYSAPVINAPIKDQGVIAGTFTKEEATALARLISTKPLPAAVILAAVDTQAGRLVVTVAAADQLDAETFNALVMALTERADSLAFESETNVEVATQRITFTLTPASAEDQQFAIEYLSRSGLLEFVDFSKPSTCKQTMPEADQYILTDYQQELYGIKQTP